MNKEGTANFGTTSVEYGDSISFKVVLAAAYSQSVVVVKCNTTVIEPNAEVYTISNITENIEITVEGVVKTLYTITFPAEVVVKRNDIALTSGDHVYYSDIIVLSPSTEPEDGYRAVFTVTGATAVTGQVNTYQVTGAVTIEYRVEEYIPTPNDYPMLNFKNYSTEEPYTVQVGAKNTNISGNITIPNKIKKDGKEYTVTIVYSKGFQDCTELTSITIPSTMKEVWSNSFNGCTNLQTVIFDNCTELTLLGNDSFKNCTSLTSIKIPASVTEIGQVKGSTDGRGKIFNGCTNLVTIDFEDDAQYASLDVFQNNTQLKNVTIPSGVGTVDATFDNNTTLETVKIQDGITSLGQNAFQWCTKLTSITFSENSQLTKIYRCVFNGCTNLTEIAIPSGVTSIEYGAFSFCNRLTKVITSSLEDWLKIFFDNEEANPLYFAHHLYVGENEVSGEVVIPNTITSIPSYTFYSCSLITSLTIPSSVTSIGGNAFGCTGLTSVTFAENSQLEYIQNGVFQNCTGITSITIPNSVIYIGGGAFAGCSSLESMILPFVGSKIKTSSETYQYPFGYLFGTSSYVGGTSVRQPYYGQNTSSTTNGNYYIPSSLRSVTILGGNILYGAFSNCSMLTCIILPTNLASIEGYALYNCSGLTEITIPNTVIGIGYGAFIGCAGLTSITIPNSVISIGDYVFSDCCQLTSITIAENSQLASIGKNTFQNCTGLSEIIIPSSVTSIGEYAFYGCSGLTSVTFDNNSQLASIGHYAFQNCMGITSIEIPNSVTSLGSGVFFGCGSLVEMTLPFIGTSLSSTTASSSTLFGYMFGSSSYTGGTSIKQYYSPTKYSTYYIPSNLRSVTILGGDILYGAFYGCSMLTNITLGTGVNLIKDNVFYNCTGLTSITISSSVTSIGQEAFNGCTGLTSITIPSSVTSIGYYIFKYCSNLVELTLPFVGESIKTSSDTNQYPLGYLFGSTSYTGGTAVTQYYYGSSTSSTTIVTYYIPSSLRSVTITGGNILYGAFYGCSMLTSIILPTNSTSIGDNAFYNCTGITSIIIPSSVTSIGQYAFYNCRFTEITIPNTVTSIKYGAFQICTRLTKVVTSSLEDWLKISFGSEQSNPLYYAKHLYIGENEVTELVIPNTVTSINAYAFYNCIGLTSITIPSSVTSIGEDAFYGCSGIIELTIPSSVTSIGKYAFYGCSGITSVTIAEDSQLTIIDNYAFEGCSSIIKVTISSLEDWLKISFGTPASNPLGYAKHLYIWENELTELVMPNTVTSINAYAFYNCKGLTNILIPSSVTSIGASAFYNCTELKIVTLAENAQLESMGNVAFYNCTGLTKVEVSSLEDWLKISINDHAANPLYYAKHLYIDGNEISGEVVIPNTITSIYSSVFYYCSLITSITIPSSVTSIGSYAFMGCSGLTEIIIPSSVTSIGEDAFYYCRGLTSITIAENSQLTSIGNYAFKDCTGLTKVVISSLEDWLKISFGNSTSNPLCNAKHLYIGENEVTELVIPNTATVINRFAFYNCIGLTSVTFENNSQLTRIEQDAFRDCSVLTNISIPSSVISIGQYAFSGCGNLVEMTLPFVGSGKKIAGDTYQNPFGYIFGSSSYTGGISVSQSYYGSSSSSTTSSTYYIPSSLRTVVVNGGSLFYGAFSNCSMLTSIVIGANVNSVSEHAFDGCTGFLVSTIYENATYIRQNGNSHAILSNINSTDVTEFNIHPDCKVICANVFKDCTGLTEITIPNNVTSIGDRAFYNCTGLTSVTFAENSQLTSIGQYAFQSCKNLTEFTMPSNVISISQFAFYNCIGLTKVTTSSIEDWLKISFGSTQSNPLFYTQHLYIGENEVTELTIPNTIKEIKKYAFYNCKGLTSITIPSSVTSIGVYAFYKCTGLTGTIILNCVTSIGEDAFYDCSSLTGITILGSMTDIGQQAFYRCNSLNKVTISSIEDWLKISFNDGSSNPLDYANHLYIGENEVTDLVIPNTITVINQYAFFGCKGLTSITIPSSVTSIGYSAFNGCTRLTSVTFAENSQLTSIASYAFENCTSLTEITIPSSVTSIVQYAFSACTNLISVTFENTSGWYYASTASATSGTSIDVSTPSTNATNLKSTYTQYYWKRNDS